MGIFSRSKAIVQPSHEEFSANFMQEAREYAAARQIRLADDAWRQRGDKPIVEYKVIEDKRIR